MAGGKNMSKYDRMVNLNRQASEAKVELAKRTIWQMLEEGERVSVPKLMARTELSRGFFYKNPEVRRELDRAAEKQAGFIDPRRGILDLAMDHEVERLRQQLRGLQEENDALRKENEKLRKALNKRNLNVIRNL